MPCLGGGVGLLKIFVDLVWKTNFVVSGMMSCTKHKSVLNKLHFSLVGIVEVGINLSIFM